MNDRGRPHRTESQLLDDIQRSAFDYFMQETNDTNGLVLDKTCPDWPARLSTYEWMTVYDTPYLYAGPLFTQD